MHPPAVAAPAHAQVFARERSLMDASQVVNVYLAGFWSGDFDRARSLVADDFSFRGPLAQADGQAAFFASAAPLAPIVRGHDLVRQWIDGEEVCSVYCCRLETARGAGSILIVEWDTVRDDRILAAQVVFDTPAFRALLPAPAEESGRASMSQTRDTVRAYHAAWTGANVARAGDFIAEEFQTRAPVGSYDTRATYLAGLANFRNRFVTGVDLLSELYGQDEAMLLYDVHTNTPAGTLRTAEHFRLVGGKIASTILVFDATEWKAMLARQGKTVDTEGRVVDLPRAE
jgi:hypothetical protein